MADFTLPSGRVVAIKDRPTYGEVCDAQDAAYESKRLNAYMQSLMASQTGLPLEGLRALTPEDGVALEAELTRRQRGDEATAPLENPSPPSSAE